MFLLLFLVWFGFHSSAKFMVTYLYPCNCVCAQAHATRTFLDCSLVPLSGQSSKTKHACVDSGRLSVGPVSEQVHCS